MFAFLESLVNSPWRWQSTNARPPAASLEETLLGVFSSTASSDTDRNLPAVECDNEQWTYGVTDLDAISDGLALGIQEFHGLRPTVAIICDNHPYGIALLLGVWKLGGILAPLDVNSPKELLKAMLGNVNPDIVVFPATDERVADLCRVLNLATLPFVPEQTTIAALSRRFVGKLGARNTHDQAQWSYPQPEDSCLYIHTSSATGPENLKCVILTHKSIITNCIGQHQLLKRHQLGDSFVKLRVLGWCPFSHIMAYACDLGTWTFMTKGCYIFASRPSSYPSRTETDVSKPSSTSMILTLVQTMIDKRPDVFTAVPWVLKELRLLWTDNLDEDGRAELQQALVRFKVFLSGGAQTDEESLLWAQERGLKVVLAIGMTGLAGGLFHSSTSGGTGWDIESLVIPGAELTLVDDDGQISDTGELFITSSYISSGYLNRVSDAFRFNDKGDTTFRTGDLYTRTSDSSLVWNGRIDDYIQLVSGEKMDPRLVEATLRALPSVSNAAVFGDNFLTGPSQFICATIEPSPSVLADDGTVPSHVLEELAGALSSVNQVLTPALRIPWSRVLVLAKGQAIPMTRKGRYFARNSGMRLTHSSDESLAAAEARITSLVASSLRISDEALRSHRDMNFSELGMDSAVAVQVVKNLNADFCLSLPPNACHIYLDLASFPLSDSDTIAPIHDDVVVVGQMIRLPGGINDPSSFWHALLERRQDIMTPIPKDRWDHESFYRPFSDTANAKDGDVTFEKAGFINTTDYENQFFGIPNGEAVHVSPSNRLMLEAVFENANIPISKIKGTKMGVFVATGVDEGYTTLLQYEKGWEAFSRFYGTGITNSTASGRVSYLLDVHGPSISLDTGCSGGLVALDLAVKYLQSSDAECAVVAAVNTQSWPGKFSFLSAQKMTSVNSRCATFSDMADGYVPSEGVVSFVLKKRSAAMRDNDSILAVIKSTEVQHNGRSQGLVAPNMHAQAELQRSTLSKAALNPSDIHFIEAHGTGTSLGDLLEIQGINEVFKTSHSFEEPLIIGAGKSCIGHTEMAAGLMGVAKAILSLRYQQVPGITHLTEANLNPNIDTHAVPLRIPVKSMSLPDAGVHRGLVLSYGFAGTIAAAVVESPGDPITQVTVGFDNTLSIFVVSAKSPGALLEYIRIYIEFLEASPAHLFRAICHTSCVGREHYNIRFACVASSMSDLIARLRSRLSSATPSKQQILSRNLIFAFPGQGLDYKGMARELSTYPDFRRILANAASMADRASDYPILEDLLSSDDGGVSRSVHRQLSTFIYQYAIAKWLEDLGITPTMVVGHSLGELAAAVTCGILSLELAIDLVIQRERSLTGINGGMAAIAAPPSWICDLIEDQGIKRANIAVYNDASNCVVSGDSDEIDVIVKHAHACGFRSKKLLVEQGFHSPCIEGGLPALAGWSELHGKDMHAPLLPFASSTLGHIIRYPSRLPSQYWVKHARQPVRFDRAIAAIQSAQPSSIILDVGPQPAIWTVLQNGSSPSLKSYSTSTRRDGSQMDAFLNALASLFEHGVAVKFEKLHAGMNQPSKVALPTYPFQRTRHYPKYIASRRITTATTDDAISSHLPRNPAEGHETLFINVLEGYFTPGHSLRASKDLEQIIISALKEALEMNVDESLDVTQPLTSLGMDSFSFTQVCREVLDKAGVEMPLEFLSDTHSLLDMIVSVVGNRAGPDVGSVIVESLKNALEIHGGASFELDEPLTSLGIDSISFTQVRKQVLARCGIELPLKYLSDEFTAADIIREMTS